MGKKCNYLRKYLPTYSLLKFWWINVLQCVSWKKGTSWIGMFFACISESNWRPNNRYYIFIHRLCSWALLKIHSNSYMFVVWYHLLVSSRILEKGSSHGFQPNQDWKFFKWQFSTHKYLNIEPTQSSKSNPKKRFDPALVESECQPWYIKNTVGITVAIWRNKSSLTTNRVISHF